MAVLCPSFEVAANALRGLGVTLNEHLLQNITCRFAGLAKNTRVECNENGQKIKSVNPILDGSCGSMDDFFELLREYLFWLNLGEASEIIFCADGGNSIWLGIDKLISEFGLSNAKLILDYTHAKQNINVVKKTIFDTLILSKKEQRELSIQTRELLCSGSIDGISDLVQKKHAGYEEALGTTMKKMDGHFGDHSKFQYNSFRDDDLPTGNGTVESAIRRIINLRIKGTGLFWKRENAENVIFLRSLVLTGKNQKCLP